MEVPYIPLKRRSFPKRTEAEARALAVVEAEMIAQIQYDRMRWLLTPPIGNTLFLTRCFSGQRLRLR